MTEEKSTSPNKKGVILTGAKLRNIFGFDTIECKFKDGVNWLYGRNGSGKSTLTIMGLWACIKGIAEQGEKFISSRFSCIGNRAASGGMEYEFTDRSNNSVFTISNTVTKAANKITFKKVSGDPISGEDLNDFLNVSLLSASNFCRMKPIEQAIAMGINTKPFDDNIAKYKEDRKIENRMIKEAGKIEEVEKVEPVDIDVLKAKKETLKKQLNEQYIKNRDENKRRKDVYDRLIEDQKLKVEEWQEEQDMREENLSTADNILLSLFGLGYSGKEVSAFINTLPKPEKEYKAEKVPPPVYIDPEIPDGSELEALEKQIEEAHATNAKAKEYSEYLTRLEGIKARQEKVEEFDKLIEEEEKAKVAYIKGKKFPFAGLEADESGGLILDGRTITQQNFSKGQLEIIVAKLAASQNPLFKTRFIDEFGILDPDNQKKIVDDLLKKGFQVIVSIPGEQVQHDNAIILRDRKIVTDTEEDERPELI